MLHVGHGLINNVDDTEEYHESKNHRKTAARGVIALLLELHELFLLFLLVILILGLYFSYSRHIELRDSSILLLFQIYGEHSRTHYECKYYDRPAYVLYESVAHPHDISERCSYQRIEEIYDLSPFIFFYDLYFFLSVICTFKKRKLLRHGVISAGAERIASHDPFNSQIAAPDRTEPSYRIDPVNGASRIKPAARRLHFRQCHSV